MGRRSSALEEVSTDLSGSQKDVLRNAHGVESKYNVDVKYVTVDVSKPESRSSSFAELEALTKDIDLGVLSERDSQSPR